jgi:Lanthionine synthetase C-like protein/HopA1 effector protein family
MSATNYLSLISAALDSLQIHGSHAYSWCGIHHSIFPRKVRSSLTEEDVCSCFVSAIQDRLYHSFYCVGTVQADIEKLLAPSSRAATVGFVQMLSDANHGADHFDPGWCVLSTSGKSVTIMKDGLRLTADLSDLHSDEAIIQGVTVSLRTGKECFGMTPGFYLAIGSAPGAVRGSAETLVRLYWNVTPAGAIRVTDELTRLLNNRNISFRLKALSDPSKYHRCDAVVLYCSKADLSCVWDAITEIYQRVRNHLKTGVPAMTKRLAPGLGLAEDPSKSTSFGLHRCNLIAEAAVRASRDNTQQLRIPVKFVAERFAEDGLDVSRPYLNHGSVDDYPIIMTRAKREQRSKILTIRQGAYLEAALAIGKALAASAIYSDESCTWVGYHLVHATLDGDGTKPSVFGTVGPCVYDGNAGIAWFLSELFAVTHDDEIGRCAAAALNGAILAAKSLPGSLFAGGTGVALAAAYASGNLCCSQLRKASLELVNRLDDRNSLPKGPDLLTGSAGLVTSLLLQSKLLDEPGLVKEASAVGERLIEAAEVRNEIPGCSWPSNTKQKHPNLTGLSHGASGVALALLQLYGATGRTEFRDCAHQGILYERALFDVKYQNWPDLRSARRTANLTSSQYRFLYYWCHGAPGIGVSRVAAWRYSKRRDYLDEARIAFRSTYAWTSRAFADSRTTGCLCHGLAGNALVLLHAEDVSTTEDSSAYRHLANAIGSQIACTVLNGKPVFGEGMQDVDNPSLMLGFAGLGHYLLQLAPVPVRVQFVSPLWLA